MKFNRLHMAVLAAMLGSAALVGCKKKEEPAPLPPAAETAPAPAPAPAAMPATASVNSVDSSQVVHEESKDITFAGDGVTDFQISKPDGWPTGKYKVEISLDGAVVQTREFEVK